MSHLVQRPEYLVIRDYIAGLQDQKRLTRESLRDAFVPVYLDMIPPGADVPSFDAVHRHDCVDVLRKKDQSNLKKLWRAIDGSTYFPLCFKAPLITALDNISTGLGLELNKLLLHNEGLYHLPIDTCGNLTALYSDWLVEFGEANSQLISDLADDGVINSDKTKKEILDTIEKSLAVLREIDKHSAN